jgi:hypothetical protein
VLDLGGELVPAGRRNRESLLALSLPLSDLLQLPACRSNLLLQRCFGFPGPLNALFGLSDIGTLGRSLLREPCKVLAGLTLLLASRLKPLAKLSKLLGARGLRLIGGF